MAEWNPPIPRKSDEDVRREIEEQKARYSALDRRGKLLANLRALADAPGHTADIISQAADEIEMLSAQDGGEWQPVETAPKDVVVIVGWWQRLPGRPDQWIWEASKAHDTRGGWQHGHATHWHPAPPPLGRVT